MDLGKQVMTVPMVSVVGRIVDVVLVKVNDLRKKSAR